MKSCVASCFEGYQGGESQGKTHAKSILIKFIQEGQKSQKSVSFYVVQLQG